MSDSRRSCNHLLFCTKSTPATQRADRGRIGLSPAFSVFPCSSLFMCCSCRRPGARGSPQNSGFPPDMKFPWPQPAKGRTTSKFAHPRFQKKLPSLGIHGGSDRSDYPDVKPRTVLRIAFHVSQFFFENDALIPGALAGTFAKKFWEAADSPARSRKREASASRGAPMGRTSQGESVHCRAWPKSAELGQRSHSPLEHSLAALAAS